MRPHIGLLLTGAILLASSAFAADNAAPADIQLQQRGHGWQLSDDKGMTLYTFERDIQPGRSACVGPCAETWPPLLVTDDTVNGSEWSMITRADGKKQWAFRGKPLYRYRGDVAAGDAFGEGLQNQWALAFMPIPTPPGIGLQPTVAGYVLADMKSFTLYTSDNDKPNASVCDLECSRTWKPVTAPAMAHPIVDWTIAARPDGTKQWAYKGKPVYRYIGEVRMAETAGDGAAKGWHAAILEPPPPRPDWVKVHASDAGELFTDSQGHTIYTWDVAGRGSNGDPKGRPGRPEDWIPVAAPPDAKPIGSWSVVLRPDGTKQWAHRGLPLFTNKNDRNPGEILGIRHGDRRFQAIMRTGLPMRGIGS